MKNFIPYYLFRGTQIFIFLILFSSYGFAQDNRAFYAGSSGKETFNDIVELSDGTLLVCGQADDLNWISISKTQINNAAISNPSPANKYSFILHLSADMSQILSCAYLNQGVADDIKSIKFQNAPGTTTSNIFISGNTSGGYFIAKLNHNFLNGVPNDFSWVYNINASGYPKSYHPWDVDNQGNVFFIRGESHGYNWASIHCLNNSGILKPIPNWRTHWGSNGEVYGTLAELGLTENDISHSGIVLKFWGRGDLRSWTQTDYEAIIPDGNGGTKQGKWPMDILFNSPWDPVNKPTGSPGYTGYKRPGTPVYGGSAIVIDKRTNNLFIGMNTKSVLPDGNPDFEPAVIAMDNSGALLWWSRLYHEITPQGQIRNSTPDQYIDQLEIDYSQPASQSSLVVLARCHGNNVENFWEGNTIAINPSANGFQNQFTGSSGNIHISWLGKLKLTDGQLNASTYVAEFAEGMGGTSGSHSDPNLDGWPSPNAGWPTLNTTRCSDLEIASDGSVCVSCKGRRTITTANAYQKMVKPSEGNGSWNQFVRQYSSDLSSMLYSSLVVGEWDISNGTGGNNTEISSILAKGNSILAVGKHKDDGGSGALGNPIPVTGVPSWGASLPSNESALSVKYNTGPSQPEEGLPTPWTNTDIGNVAATGDASYNNGTFTLDGSGKDIWGNTDEFQFVYQSLNGDGEIVAQVNSLTNTHSWAKAGVMIRESLDGNSKHAMSVITWSNGVSFQRRTSTGSSSASTKIAGLSTPVWVKLSRNGNVFTSSYSADGNNWTEIGNVNISMDTSAFVGLCLTSHNDGTIATATYDNVTVNTGGSNARIASQSILKEEVNQQPEVILYPNPVKEGKARIDLKGFTQDNSIQLKIFNIEGKLLLDENIKNTTTTYQLNTQKFAGSKGIYLVKIISGESIFNKRLIID
ncbi:T9SS type A sorting domain-containing protein [Flexithrix dorotheae]|uniref:T9SS type A sorting domain-containing protein n=1 Tax=Flexithrix dorotheae TaxID=70993 RepID=UPI0012FA5D65|nr:T9SS type A sorting domain-containing protein [Flexithrix dorotheae]